MYKSRQLVNFCPIRFDRPYEGRPSQGWLVTSNPDHQCWNFFSFLPMFFSCSFALKKERYRLRSTPDLFFFYLLLQYNFLLYEPYITTICKKSSRRQGKKGHTNITSVHDTWDTCLSVALCHGVSSTKTNACHKLMSLWIYALKTSWKVPHFRFLALVLFPN